MLILSPGGSPPSDLLPLDVLGGALWAFSRRALATATIGAPLYTLRRDSDDATQTFASTVGGDSPTVDIEAFLGGASGYATTWFDQSGSSNDVQQLGEPGLQPEWLAASAAGPGLNFGNSTAFFGAMATAGDVAVPAGDFAIYVVFRRAPEDVLENIFGVTSADFSTWFTWTIGNDGSSYVRDQNTNDGITAVVNDYEPMFDDLPHVLFAYAAADGTLYSSIDGQPTDIFIPPLFTTGIPGYTAPVAVGADDGAGATSPFLGYVLELAAWATIPSSDQLDKIIANVVAEYGIG